MPKEQILVNDIVTQHRERMLNLKKYYPFFRLSEVSFSWFKDGEYADRLDMGYILMAVLRFFIEENNFKERDVTYGMYFDFMTSCIKRDFGIELSAEDNKVLADYIFDKMKNDGRPFNFEYYDPVDRVKRVSRVKLLESRIQDGTVWYSISSDGIEFYLDTKEIRDESKISVEQLLLEKMIKSSDFKGGAEVIRRINNEVDRLWSHRNKVREMLADDVFAGVEEYEKFFDTGIKWFDEEQKLFVRNKELIEGALKRAEGEKETGESDKFYRTVSQIYRLDTELKVAMNNHSRLLRACTELGIEADEAVRRAKLGRLRSRFDFRDALKTMMDNDRPDMLEFAVKPFMALNTHKTFDLSKIEDILNYHPQVQEKAEKVSQEKAESIVFEDELDEARFEANARTLTLILLEMLRGKDSFSLREYNDTVKRIFSDEIDQNGDYYAFLVHLCGKDSYTVGSDKTEDETFLEAIIQDFAGKEENGEFAGMKFRIIFPEDEAYEIDMGNGRSVTDFVIERIKNGEQKS
ncbi:MAG: hypothetical protein ACI4EU_05985 [Butyrivibrio sp.]